MAGIQTRISFVKKKNVSPAIDKENKLKNSENDQTPKKGYKRTSKTEGEECSPPKISKSPTVLLENLNLNNIQEVQNRSSAIRALHTAQPCQLPGREDKIDEISLILEKSLKTLESTSLYISGQPGTGKTACLNHIMSQPDVISGFKNVYVNCTGMKSSKAVYKRISEELDIKIKSTDEKLSHNTILNYLKGPHKMVLLVLDEMDQLESKHQSILYSIFEWPSVPDSKIVLIGIANALDLTDRVLPRLQARVELQPIQIHFTPYTKNEIIDILTHRLNEAGVVDVLTGPALQLLSSKVASVSGDIRKALDVARRVIEISQTDDKQEKPVTLQDVLSVVNNVYNTATALNEDDSETFPLQQKILICSTVLIKTHSKAKELSIGRLFDVYKKICNKKNMGALDLSEFLSLAQLVESRGIIKIQGKNKNRLSKVTLQWDVNEISSALKDKQLISSILDDTSCL